MSGEGQYKPLIDWFVADPKRIKQFERSYEDALKNGDESFVIRVGDNGQPWEVLVTYAKYFLEYLKTLQTRR